MIAQVSWVLDSSFADNGKLVLDIDELDDFSRIIYDDNNNIYFFGAAGNYTTYIDYDFVIGRIDQNGDLDSTFGTDGLYKGDFYNQISSHIVDAFYSDGYITFLAQSQTPSSLDTSFIAVGRIDTLGNVDSTFGINGVFGGPFLGPKTQPNGLELLSDGRMLLTGTTFDSAYAHREVALVGRLTENGLPDSTFGGTGFMTWDYLDGLQPALFYIPDLMEKHDLGSSFSCAIENPWGDYLIGGYLDIGSYTRCLTVRISTSGTLVTTFGYGGYFSFDHLPDNNSYVIDMKNWQGKVLISANEYAQNDFILTSISETSAVSAWTSIDIFGNKDVGSSIYVDSVENVYVTGYTKDPSLTSPGYASEMFTMLKLNADLSIDTNFMNDGIFLYDFQSGDEHGCSDFSFSNQDIILGGYLNNYTSDNFIDFGFVKLKKTFSSATILNNETTEWKVYPNPATEQIYLGGNISMNEKVTVEVFTMLGQLIKQVTFENSEQLNPIDISLLTSGMYFLQITQGGTTYLQKLKKN